jgi:diguanylate cyclase (GGDEF)-like protein/PAS domain S-box-containing protein
MNIGSEDWLQSNCRQSSPDKRHDAEGHAPAMPNVDGRCFNEELFRCFFDRSPEMFCIIHYHQSQTGLFSLTNSIFLQTCGYVAHEVLGSAVVDFLHPEDRDFAEPMFRYSYAKEHPFLRFVFRYRYADKTYHWLEWSLRFDPEHNVQYAVVHDITDLKSAEHAACLSDDMLREFFNAIGEPAYLINAADGVIIEHNESFAARLHMDGQSLRGRKLFEVLPIEEFRKVQRRIEEVISGGKIRHIESQYDDRFIFSTFYPIRDHKGGVVKVAVLGQDISWLRQAEETMILNEERLESLLNLTQMGMSSEEEIQTYALEAAVSLTRSTYGFLLFLDDQSKDIKQVLWSRDVQRDCMIKNTVSLRSLPAGCWAESFRRRCPVIMNFSAHKKTMPAGHIVIEHFMSFPVFDEDRIVAIVGVANKDVQYDETDAAHLGLLMHTMWVVLKQQRATELLKQYSLEDPLTCLANRRKFDDMLSIEWRHALRENQVLSLFFIDIDFFKKFNDLYGHQQGDVCLKKVAVCLRSVLNRAGDLIARYGGEEFVAILPNTSLEGAIRIAERMRRSVMHLAIPHEDSKIASVVTISLGIVTCYPCIDITLQEILETADRALYEAKWEGRNTIRWHVLGHV